MQGEHDEALPEDLQELNAKRGHDYTRLSLLLSDEEEQALTIIKAYYGTQSPYTAIRRAIVEHAKQIGETHG
jgi:hypothetical protein